MEEIFSKLILKSVDGSAFLDFSRVRYPYYLYYQLRNAFLLGNNLILSV